MNEELKKIKEQSINVLKGLTNEAEIYFQKDSSVLHDLLIKLKLDSIKESHPGNWPETVEKFFKNLDILG